MQGTVVVDGKRETAFIARLSWQSRQGGPKLFQLRLSSLVCLCSSILCFNTSLFPFNGHIDNGGKGTALKWLLSPSYTELAPEDPPSAQQLPPVAISVVRRPEIVPSA